MTDATDRPGLGKVIDDIVQVRRAEVHTSYMARVLEYDHQEQRATVQPIVQFARRSPDDETRELYKPPPVPGCPVHFFATGGQSITAPLQVGDRVRCVVMERSHDEWQSTDNGETSPQDARRFDLSDTVVVPGTRSFADTLDEVTDALVLASDTEVHLGQADPANFLSRDDRVDSNLAAIESKLNALISEFNTAVTAAQSSGSPVPIADPGDTQITPYSRTSTASDKVKGE